MEKVGCFLEDCCHYAGHECAERPVHQAALLSAPASGGTGVCAVPLASSHENLHGVVPDALGIIARNVGYASEYAFSRAFTRELGVPPSRYRRTANVDA
ncbi:AraC family transcriptional regulator [Streptomyces goshikiensis]|uniref:AraC family transcriptional regulator n=1 Tax=Streptomyces goshikiensis TaxID=1942 RepID=UPI003666E630